MLKDAQLRLLKGFRKAVAKRLNRTIDRITTSQFPKKYSSPGRIYFHHLIDSQAAFRIQWIISVGVGDEFSEFDRVESAMRYLSSSAGILRLRALLLHSVLSGSQVPCRCERFHRESVLFHSGDRTSRSSRCLHCRLCRVYDSVDVLSRVRSLFPPDIRRQILGVCHPIHIEDTY